MAVRAGSADGPGSAAQFQGPGGVAVDSAGNVYVADTYNNTMRLGRPACPDAPTIDLVSGPVGQARQLDTSPQTAVARQWRLVRIPAGSATASWTANVRNPTFTPDVADLLDSQDRSEAVQQDERRTGLSIYCGADRGPRKNRVRFDARARLHQWIET